ncbi:39S ribosomal protein L41 [Blattella germanica]|nr:39S ribosomal protein L41 [Blattella germanica]
MAGYSIGVQQYRSIFTSATCYGKRNFRKFLLYNKRGTKFFKQRQAIVQDPEFFHDLGARPIGVKINNEFVTIPEMVPELVVPDLTDFKLKPYVSYRVADVVQSTFTPKDLFDAVYSEKIVNDFEKGKISESGESTEPSAEENLSPEEAFNQARKTGSDIFANQ